MSVIHPHKGKLALSVFGGSFTIDTHFFLHPNVYLRFFKGKSNVNVEENVATIDKERKKVSCKKMSANYDLDSW